MLERHEYRIVEVERERPLILILITTQVVKCVSLEGEIVSLTNLIDHNHQILVMLENY